VYGYYVFSQPFFCSNIRGTRFFWLHIVAAGTVGQRFLINKKRWENKKTLKARFLF